MPIQPSELPKTFSGSYSNLRLDFTPEALEPRERWSQIMANYPTRLAWLRVYLDGEEALPIDRVPSAYCFNLFTGLLRALPVVRAGESATADWLSDPWRIDLRGYPDRDVVIITVHLPELMAPLDHVSVPLSKFAREVLRVCHKWLRYINEAYSDETGDPKLGEDYRRFKQRLLEAERVAK